MCVCVGEGWEVLLGSVEESQGKDTEHTGTTDNILQLDIPPAIRLFANSLLGKIDDASLLSTEEKKRLEELITIRKTGNKTNLSLARVKLISGSLASV